MDPVTRRPFVAVGQIEDTQGRCKESARASVPPAKRLSAAAANAVPNCAGHQRRCWVKTSTKDVRNRGRSFFVCSMRGTRHGCSSCEPVRDGPLLEEIRNSAVCPRHLDGLVSVRAVAADGAVSLRCTKISGSGWCCRSSISASSAAAKVAPPMSATVDSTPAYVPSSESTPLPAPVAHQQEDENDRSDHTPATTTATTAPTLAAGVPCTVEAALKATTTTTFGAKATSTPRAIPTTETTTTQHTDAAPSTTPATTTTLTAGSTTRRAPVTESEKHGEMARLQRLMNIGGFPAQKREEFRRRLAQLRHELCLQVPQRAAAEQPPAPKPQQEPAASVVFLGDSDDDDETDSGLSAALTTLSIADTVGVSKADLARVRAMITQSRRVCEEAWQKASSTAMVSPLACTLLPHQQVALAWMTMREERLSEGPRGGILADDMGLGKTVSMLALLAHQGCRGDSSVESSTGGTLVVLPTSLLSQWRDEITLHAARQRWSVLVWHGATARRATAEQLCSADLVLTTYGMIETEARYHKRVSSSSALSSSSSIKALSRVVWSRIVLDEAHSLRNAKSATTQAVVALPGVRRWMLTGTPMHNALDDLQTPLAFLRFSPFSTPAVFANLLAASSSRLALVLDAILLRRCKTDRLADGSPLVQLPPRKVVEHTVTLDAHERTVYSRIASDASLNPLTRLLRLRQTCIHTSLVDESIPKSVPSSKLDRLQQHIEQALNDFPDDACVIVSEWTSVLDLLASRLAPHTALARIDGSLTADERTHQLARFNSNNNNNNRDGDEDDEERNDGTVSPRVMLLSLRAGGVGLNLTRANRLFFVDAHWNPQLQSQASDRIFRLGQTKRVEVHSFVCEGTVEERIVALQTTKTHASQRIVRDASDLVEPDQLTRAQWDFLFKA